MRRTTHAGWVLYGSLAVGLLGCALMSHQNGHWPGVLFFTAAAMGQGLAIVHTSWLLDEYRHVLRQLDAATRPRITTRADVAVQQALADACCEQWWTTLGAPHQCTRKDQTT